MLTFGFIRKSFKSLPNELLTVIFDYSKYVPSRILHEDEGNAKEELDKLLSEEELKGIPLLVYANKQDSSKAMDVEDIKEKLGLDTISQKDRNWHIQASIATIGEGMWEGLDWLYRRLK